MCPVLVRSVKNELSIVFLYVLIRRRYVVQHNHLLYTGTCWWGPWNYSKVYKSRWGGIGSSSKGPAAFKNQIYLKLFITHIIYVQNYRFLKGYMKTIQTMHMLVLILQFWLPFVMLASLLSRSWLVGYDSNIASVSVN